jgi:hypothetical protein
MYSLIPLLLVLPLSNAAAVQVTVPATPSTSNVVHSNFLGISFELSFMTDYCRALSTGFARMLTSFLSWE